MTSIGAVGRVTPAYQPSRIPARAPDSTPTPATNPIDRVDNLTRQLDASLSNRLSSIRARIAPSSTASAEPAATSRRLDIGA